MPRGNVPAVIDRRYKSGRNGRLPRRLTGEKPESLGALVLPTALHGEVAGFEQRNQAVGEFTLEFEGAAFDFAAAAEGGFQIVKQSFEFRVGPSGGEAFEDEDGFAAAVGGGPAEEEAFSGGGAGRLARPLVCSRTREPRVPIFLGFAALDFEGGEGVGERGGCRFGRDALFLFAGHAFQCGRWAAAEDGRPPKNGPLEGERPREPRAFFPIVPTQRSQRFFLM